MATNRAFCLARGPMPATNASLANGNTILGIQVDRNTATNFSVDPNNRWWGGPEEIGPSARLFIAHPVPFDGNPSAPNTQPVPSGVNPPSLPDNPAAGVGFWGSPSSKDTSNQNDYIAIGNNAWRVVNGTPGTFTTDTQVRAWVKSQGYWDNYAGAANTSAPNIPAVQP